MGWLVRTDETLLRFLNVEWTHPFLDQVIPVFSDLDKWAIPLLCLGALVLIRERRKGILILIALGLTLLVSETLSTWVVKRLVGRIRPCHIYDWVRVVGYCPRSPSFPSTHATNMFAAATFLAFFFPRWTGIFLAVGVLVGYSRVYKGVHYPFDVIGGAVLGAACAVAAFLAVKWMAARWPRVFPVSRSDHAGSASGSDEVSTHTGD